MPTLTVNGHSVTVDDGFAKLSPQDQDATVAEIAKSLPQEKPSGAVEGFKQGIANAIHGPAETLKTFAGVDTSKMEKAAQAVAPKDYKRGDIIPEDGHWYDPRSYNWKNVPQMLAENSPQMAESIAAAKLGSKIHPLVGLAAGAVPFALNSLGDTAKTAAVTRTGDDAAIPETADKLRAAGTVAAQSVPQMLGVARLVNPGSVAAVGVRGAAQALGKGAVTTGIEGATGAAQDAIGQAGMSVGTDGGVTVDPNKVAEAGVGQGILGGAMQAPKMLANVAAAKKYAKFGGDNAASTERVANLIKEAADGDSLKDTKVGYTATRQTHEDILARLDAAAKATTSSSPETARVLSRAAKGRELSDADLSHLEQHSTPEVATLARDAHVAAMLKGQGDFSNGPGTFTGGVANAVGKHVRAIQNPAGAAVSAGIGATIGGAHAASLFAYSPETLAAIGGAYGVMRGVDALSGNRSPANKFVSKFGTEAPTAPPTSPTQPQPPATTSVPQVAPPRAPLQPWGAAPPPAGPNNTLPSGPWGLKPPMMNPTGPQVAPPSLTPPPAPTPPPTPLNATALQAQVKAALQMYSSRSKFDAKKQKEDDGADIPSFLPERIPSFLPKRAADVPAAPVEKATEAPLELPAKFSRMLGRTDPSPPADIPSFLPAKAPDAPAAPVAPVEQVQPSVSELVARLGARRAVDHMSAARPENAAFPPAAITKTKAGEVKSTPESIRSPAIKLTDGRIFTGPNHVSIMDDISKALGKRDIMDHIEPTDTGMGGFVTNTGRLVGREEAAKIAGKGTWLKAEELSPTTAPTPIVMQDNPYPQKVVDKSFAPRDHTKADTTKLTPHDAVNSNYDLTNDYVPLQAHELHGKHKTHDEFAASETAAKLGEVTAKGTPVLEKENAQAYHDGIVRDRVKREKTLQELSQSSVSESDTPALQALLDQLHHIRRGETAKAAIYHYTSMMSPALRTKVLRRLDSSFIHAMWSKEK